MMKFETGVLCLKLYNGHIYLSRLPKTEAHIYVLESKINHVLSHHPQEQHYKMIIYTIFDFKDKGLADSD